MFVASCCYMEYVQDHKKIFLSGMAKIYNKENVLLYANGS